MSERKITAAFAPDVKRLARNGSYEGLYIPLVMDDVTVKGLHFSAEFLMDRKSSNLAGVNLKSIERQLSPSSFWSLEKALIEEYGMPSDRSNGGRLLTSWKLPSTTILMVYGESPLAGHYLFLNYAQAANPAGDKPAPPGSGRQ